MKKTCASFLYFTAPGVESRTVALMPDDVILAELDRHGDAFTHAEYVESGIVVARFHRTGRSWRNPRARTAG